MSNSTSDDRVQMGDWDRFWFSPASMGHSGMIRSLLCLCASIYFVSAWGDVAFWYADGGPFSPLRVATFLQSAGLEDAARWIVSPLFLTETVWVYQLYLIAGIVTAFVVAAGRGGRFAPWVLWLLFIGWANRAMILSGLTETVLSLGLFASAVAPPVNMARALQQRVPDSRHWMAGLSQRLLATQVTIILLATFVTMLAGRVWFNGSGAYALAASAMDRSIDWTESMLVNPNVHETLTHFLVLAIPVGLLLAWISKTNRLGQAILLTWCLVVSLLGSHWLYGLSVSVMVLAIVPVDRSHAAETS